MDNVTRMIGQRFTETWGQQVIVDDRPGAAGIIGHEIAAKAPADGYTLLLASSAGAITNPLLTKVPYDTTRDFAPISLVINSIQMLSSNPSVPASNLQELLALARARSPDSSNCGSSGQNSSNHLACEMLKGHGTRRFRARAVQGHGAADNRHHERPGAVRLRQHPDNDDASEARKSSAH